MHIFTSKSSFVDEIKTLKYAHMKPFNNSSKAIDLVRMSFEHASNSPLVNLLCSVSLLSAPNNSKYALFVLFGFHGIV